MDKYFEPHYDPRLDFSLEDVTDSSGLIAPGVYEGRETMLSVVKERKEEKKERERREKEARKEERELVREARRARKEGRVPEDKVVGLMASEGYAKKGGVREWDQGKEDLS